MTATKKKVKRVTTGQASLPTGQVGKGPWTEKQTWIHTLNLLRNIPELIRVYRGKPFHKATWYK